MITRSQTRKMELIVDIDFDDASIEWKKNKKSIGQGMYMYICEKQISPNRKCSKPACVGNPFCKIHS
jgi:hypothetical protein